MQPPLRTASSVSGRARVQGAGAAPATESQKAPIHFRLGLSSRRPKNTTARALSRPRLRAYQWQIIPAPLAPCHAGAQAASLASLAGGAAAGGTRTVPPVAQEEVQAEHRERQCQLVAVALGALPDQPQCRLSSTNRKPRCCSRDALSSAAALNRGVRA